MRRGTRFIIFGMNRSGVLLEIPGPIHGLASHTKNVEIWQAMLPPCVRLLASFACSMRGANCTHAVCGSWGEATLDDVVCNSHLDSFADLCHMLIAVVAHIVAFASCAEKRTRQWVHMFAFYFPIGDVLVL